MYAAVLQRSGSCSIFLCCQGAFDNLLFRQYGTVISGSCSVVVCRQDAFENFLFKQDDTVCSCRAELGYNDMSNTCFLNRNNYGYWISKKTKFWKLRGDGGAQSDSANPAELISFVSFSTHSVCTIYCPREFVSCTAHTNTYGGLDMQTGLDIPMAASK